MPPQPLGDGAAVSTGKGSGAIPQNSPGRNLSDTCRGWGWDEARQGEAAASAKAGTENRPCQTGSLYVDLGLGAGLVRELRNSSARLQPPAGEHKSQGWGWARPDRAAALSNYVTESEYMLGWARL